MDLDEACEGSIWSLKPTEEVSGGMFLYQYIPEQEGSTEI